MGKNWAIAIGINQYDNLQPLNFAKRDAEEMTIWFREDAKFDQAFLFSDDSPPIPTNPPIPTQPTYGKIRRFLQAQFNQPLLKPEDNLWFFFAGHGKRYADKDYLMLADSDPGDVEHTAISVEYVIQRLRRCGADNIVLFLDACRDESSRGGLGIGTDQHQGVITFYSCAANQKSWEITELQHGAFTYALLSGLRLHGEANCATVERLDRYLTNAVPQLNARYKKPIQNPYLKAEPPYKMYYILLDNSANLRDIEPLKYRASIAENEKNLDLAEQLWMRVNFAARGSDLDAKKAFERIAIARHTQTEKQVFLPIYHPEVATASRSDTTIKNKDIPQFFDINQLKHEYRDAFNLAINQEFPLKYETHIKLIKFQKSLGLNEEDVREIEQEIIRNKEAAIRKNHSIVIPVASANKNPPLLMNRRKFLTYGSLGTLGLLTSIGLNQILNHQQPHLETFSFTTVKVDQIGNIIQTYPDQQAKLFQEDLGNGIILEMVKIPGGSFTMGSPLTEQERRENEPTPQIVKIPSFFLGKFQITQEQYQQIMGKNPAKFLGKKRPVEMISGNDAIEFCQTLSQKTGRIYRLPNEAEWEYACRAGTTTPFYFGETITTNIVNYNGDYTYGNAPKGKDRQQTTDVGTFPPNAFGLYDMHGNVWEWCTDTSFINYKSLGKSSAKERDKNLVTVLRGGSWINFPQLCRSAYRLELDPMYFDDFYGFRVACNANFS